MIRGLVYLTGLVTLGLIGIVAAVAYRVHDWPWGEYIEGGRRALSDKLDPRDDGGRGGREAVAREGPARPWPTGGLESPTPPPQPQRESRPVPFRHEVRRGETLYAIARDYYGDPLRWQQIARANDIRRPSDLRIGRVIVIPPAAPGTAEPVSYPDLRLALAPAFDGDASREEEGP